MSNKPFKPRNPKLSQVHRRKNNWKDNHQNKFKGDKKRYIKPKTNHGDIL